MSEEDNDPPFLIDGAHVGWSCSEALRVTRDHLSADAPRRRSPDEMREYLESAPDTVDWKVGYAQELAHHRRTIPGPQDKLADACRFIVRELGSMYPEMPVGAWGEAGLPLVLHQGVGRSATYEMVGRSQAKWVLRYLDTHPQHAHRPVFHMQFADNRHEDFLLDARMEADGLTLSRPGLHPTGFQIGWAVNAAKYVLGYPPVPNPAFMRLSDEQAEQLETTTLPSGHVAIFDRGTGPHD